MTIVCCILFYFENIKERVNFDMGNLIKDFWTYEYKDKNYFGIIEVIKGEDLAQNRVEKKYETHIERALDYTMKYDVLSHMSIQTHCTWLKDKPSRDDNDQKYYPFILEFESKGKTSAKQNKDAEEVILEVATYVKYLITELAINKDDIVIMINNSKSIYVFVNPKVFAAKPDKDIHKIYYKMYENLKNELGLKYVDESIVSSGYKLMKTPNTYYKGGYFVWITIDELMELLIGVKTKKELTKKKRSLDKEIPGLISMKASKLYSNAVKSVKYGYKQNNDKDNKQEFKCHGACVQYMQEHMIEKGFRNFGLVSVAIYLKSLGHTKEEVQEKLIELGSRWNHDESKRAIKAKVNSVFRKNYKFSCKYAQSVFADMGVENMCKNCPYSKQKSAAKSISGIDIDSNIINSLWINKASTRHYLLYLQLVKKSLLNKAFVAADEEIDERTLKEFCKYALISFKKISGEVYITYTSSKKLYRLPDEFMNDTLGKLGDTIKQYLRLFVKGYKANSKYMIIRSSIETLMDDLNYKDAGSVYRLFRKLKDIGLLNHFVKTSTLTLYYSSYKIISINDVKEENKEQEQLKVVGEQISIYDFRIKDSSNDYKANLEKKNNINLYRGSPPKPKNSG